MKLTFLPRTNCGWIGLVGIAGFCFCLALFFFLNAVVPDTGVDGFFANPHLALPLLAAWAFATVGLFAGLLAMILKKDYAVIAFLAVLIGAFVMFWALAEIFAEGA